MSGAFKLSGTLRFKFLRPTQESSRLTFRYDSLRHRAVVFHPDLGLVADLDGSAIVALTSRGMLLQYGEGWSQTRDPHPASIEELYPGSA